MPVSNPGRDLPLAEIDRRDAARAALAALKRPRDNGRLLAGRGESDAARSTELAIFQPVVSIATTRLADGMETKRRSPSADSAQSSPAPGSGTRAKSRDPPNPKRGSTMVTVASSFKATT